MILESDKYSKPSLIAQLKLFLKFLKCLDFDPPSGLLVKTLSPYRISSFEDNFTQGHNSSNLIIKAFRVQFTKCFPLNSLGSQLTNKFYKKHLISKMNFCTEKTTFPSSIKIPNK